jgi:hypothetical protein
MPSVTVTRNAGEPRGDRVALSRRSVRARGPVSRHRNGDGATPGSFAASVAGITTLGCTPSHIRCLGCYSVIDARQSREVLALARPDGSTLVIDCLPGALSDARLIARLACDEPPENAEIVSEMYLADERRGRCRRLTAQDLDPCRRAELTAEVDTTAGAHASLRDARGRLYVIRELPTSASGRELRWTRSCGADARNPFDEVTLRDVVGGLQDYEPARAITLQALIPDRLNGWISTRRLREEMQRLQSSPIVLNRLLRETVERHLEAGLTMSEIAMRCDRTKRDRHGTRSGETSWLARRIGQMTEPGEVEPSPWVHTDTLALIVRTGLGMSPNEVEL